MPTQPFNHPPIDAPRAALTRRRRSIAGSVLLEVMISASILALALSGIYYSSIGAIRMLDAGNDSSVAFCAVQERVDQLRGYSWTELTDSTPWIDHTITDPETGEVEPRDGFLKKSPLASATLRDRDLNETVTVSAYRLVASAEPVPSPICVQRNAAGDVTMSSNPTSLVDEKMIKVDISLSWKSRFNRKTHTMATSVLLGRN